MTSSDIFEKHFKSKNLRRIYQEIVSLSPSIGIDNMSHETFWRFQKQEIKKIRKKCLAGTYKFNK